jgi:DNA-binding NtrC family response regulator
MDLSLQTKLLRFLQTSTIQPVGATKARMVDVRIVCATNRDPLAEVRAGRFREDLYYRLHVVPIHLPPLRERAGDVLEIADKILTKFNAEEGKNFTSFSPEVRDIFTAMAWPGNVRQLMNAIRNVVVLNDGPMVLPEMLPTEVTLPRQIPTRANGVVTSSRDAMRTLEQTHNIAAFIGTPLATLEREFIEATIEFCDGSIPQAARLLDVSPSTLYRKKEGWEKNLTKR